MTPLFRRRSPEAKRICNTLAILFCGLQLLSCAAKKRSFETSPTAPAPMANKTSAAKDPTSAASAVPAISAAAGESEPDADAELEAEFEDEFGDEFKTVSVADPLEPFNRAMFHFNDKLYFWLLKPVARGYRVVVPSLVRVGLKNFFTNLTAPVRFANCLLQGKLEAAEIELGRFVFNTTAGVLGFGNPSRHYPKLQPVDQEDFGQTLGLYGIGNGIYIVWPIFGPSTLRDTVGLVGDGFLTPTTYVEPFAAAAAIRGTETINDTSFRIGDYETLKEAALDPYTAMRDGYVQGRNTKISE